MDSEVYIDKNMVVQVEEWEQYIVVLNNYLEKNKSCFEGDELEQIYSKKTEFEKILKEMREKIDDNKKNEWYFVDKDTENYLFCLKIRACRFGSAIKKIYNNKKNLQ
tara:strand:+ start:2094 stop:2414 length:321 start_codon:yes stop_codon:yes gene_type:complete